MTGFLQELGGHCKDLFVCFVFIVSVSFVVCFNGATKWFGSLAVLGGGSGDGLSRGVAVDWCGLLARGGIGAAKGSTWECDTDAARRQHALSTRIHIE